MQKVRKQMIKDKKSIVEFGFENLGFILSDVCEGLIDFSE